MFEWKKRLRSSGPLLRGFIPRKKSDSENDKKSQQTDKLKIWLVIAMTFVILLVLLTPDILLRGYRWNLGEVTPKNIIAPFSFSVENRQETENLRKIAEQTAPLVFNFDRQTDDRILQEVLSIFSTAQQIAIQPDINQVDKIETLFQKIGFPISKKSEIRFFETKFLFYQLG